LTGFGATIFANLVVIVMPLPKDKLTVEDRRILPSEPAEKILLFTSEKGG
jgi:hypothetical protein